MRELVVNSAEAFQFEPQKWHDLPRGNRGQKSCKCKPGFRLAEGGRKLSLLRNNSFFLLIKIYLFANLR